MKTRLLFAITTLALAGALGARPMAQVAGVVGTSHDLRTAAGVTANAQICITCHTPHNANPPRQSLLWNRTLTGAGTFSLYDSTVNPDFAGGTPDLTAGNATSLLCLGCHDGSIALNVVYNNSPLSATDYLSSTVTGAALLASDLRNDHPVGFDYSSSVTAKPLEYNASPTGVKLSAGRVECSSCHNVHSDANNPFLRVAIDNSQLCLSCHL